MKIICLDIETTGLNKDNDKIIEVGAALVDLETREIEKTFESFVSPGVKLPNLITHLTGITDEMLVDAPRLTNIKSEIQEFIADYPIMGHNINFDMDFLEAAGIPTTNVRLDSMDIAHITVPKAESYSLEIIASELGVEETGQHRALKDVKDNIDILFRLIDTYFSKNNLEEVLPVIEKSKSPWRQILLEASRTFKKVELRDPKHEEVSHAPLPIQHDSKTALIELDEYKHQALANEQAIVATNDETIHTILDKNQYLDEELFEKMLKKDSLTPEETTFALKIFTLGKPHPIAKTDITIPFEIKNLWWDLCCEKYPQEILKKLEETTVITGHSTLAKLAKNHEGFLDQKHLIIDEIDEFYDNIQRSFTAIYTQKRFLRSSLSDETKDRLTILFGYIGILYEKFGQQFELELNDYHMSTIEWKKTADLIDKIAAELSTESEEAQLLKFLAKIKGKTHLAKISIGLMQDSSPLIKVIPQNLDDLLFEKIWSKTAQNTLISTAVTYAEEENQGQFLSRLLKLPSSTETIIRSEKDLNIELVSFLPHPKDNEFTSKASNHLLKTLPEAEKPTFVLINSQRASLSLHQHIALPLQKEGISVLAQNASGGMGKIKNLSKRSPESTVLVGTPGLWQMLKPEIKTLFIYQTPFSAPNKIPAAFITGGQSFKTYTMPRAMLQMKKVAKAANKTYVMDNRIHQI